MKTQIIILTLFLIIHTNLALARTHDFKHARIEKNKIEFTLNIRELVPVTPRLADFTDGLEKLSEGIIPGINLAPVTPKEADFEDCTKEIGTKYQSLAPITPKEADFTDL